MARTSSRPAGPAFHVLVGTLVAVLAVNLMACIGTSGGWVAYYGQDEPAHRFRSYDLIVFDADHHPPFESLKGPERTIVGYLSLGEVENNRAHFEMVRRSGLLRRENPNWPGSFYVDVRDERWRNMVVDELVPAILAKGFDGVFLDTLDNSIELERVDPDRYAGMTDAAAELVLAIRARHPDITIMVNRAYELLPRIEHAIDVVLGESVYTDYDFQARTYRLHAPEAYRYQVELLRAARERQPDLLVVTLDYWDPKDRKTVRQIYREQRANGFIPYVATIDLHRLVPEP